MLEILNKRGGEKARFQEQDLETVMLFLEPAAIALENATLFQKTTELTLMDDLTIFSHKVPLPVSQERDLEAREVRIPPRGPLSGPGRLQGRQRHQRTPHGSTTLKIVAKILTAGVRSIDIVARYGGDEFTLLLPNTDKEGALIVAERLRKSIEDHAYEKELGVKIKLSASFGVSIFPHHAQDPESLIQKADQAMYKVKESTKNAVALSD